MDIALLRKSLLQAIEARETDGRRAARPCRRSRQPRYEAFLDRRRDAGVPRDGRRRCAARGCSFDVITPSGGVRLVPERTREDGIELGLDPTVTRRSRSCG